MGENNVKRQVTAVEHFNPEDSASLFMQTSLFDQVQRAAIMMSKSHLVPAHLQGDDKVADCFLVIEQAMRWRLSPFAVAQSTYVLRGVLGYAGKLIAGIVNTSNRLDGSLRYDYAGAGTDRKIVVSGTLKGEKESREIDGTVKQWATDQWRPGDYDQRLAYRGAREWARRHMPEVLLGVYADEEIEQMVSRPTVVSVSPETLEDFVTPDKVETKEDPKAKPEPKVATVIDVKAEVEKTPVGKAPDATAGENTAKAKKSPKDATIDELFG